MGTLQMWIVKVVEMEVKTENGEKNWKVIPRDCVRGHKKQFIRVEL